MLVIPGRLKCFRIFFEVLLCLDIIMQQAILQIITRCGKAVAL
jgi:hypothetical protein